jgi:hypothetical protein
MRQATGDSLVYHAHLATPLPAKVQQHSLTALRMPHCTETAAGTTLKGRHVHTWCCKAAMLLVPGQDILCVKDRSVWGKQGTNHRPVALSARNG